MTFLVSSRRRRKDEFIQHDRYGDWGIAKEMAEELANYHGHYEVVVFNSKGVEVFNSRRQKGT